MLSMIPQVMDVVAGVQQAKDTAVNTIKPTVNTVLVPILAIVVGIVCLISVARCVHHHNRGEEFSANIALIGICLVVIAVIVSFPQWGWTMIGQ